MSRTARTIRPCSSSAPPISASSRGAAAQQPPSATLREAERLDREGTRYCDMQETKATQGANEIAEALHMIGVHPSL